MGARRNGSSTFIRVLLIACRVSHFPGFVNGLTAMVGATSAEQIYDLWNPLCVYLEGYMGTDDHPFKKDFTTGTEPQDVEVA